MNIGNFLSLGQLTRLVNPVIFTARFAKDMLCSEPAAVLRLSPLPGARYFPRDQRLRF